MERGNELNLSYIQLDCPYLYQLQHLLSVQPSPPPLPIYLLRHSPQAVPFHLSAHQVMTVAHLQPPYHPPANTPSPQVIRGELSRLCSEKAADPDKVLPRLLEACGTELGDPPQHIVILSLLLARVPTRWKTSSLSPVP